MVFWLLAKWLPVGSGNKKMAFAQTSKGSANAIQIFIQIQKSRE